MSECGACAGLLFAPFFHGREWSTTGRYLDMPEKQGPSITVELEYCQSCGLIRQAAGKIVHLDYVHIERGTAKQLPEYAARIIASLSEFGVSSADLIVEVGANDGTFLKELRGSGFRKLVGVEPSKQLAEISSKAGFDIVNGYFDRSLAAGISRSHGRARAVVCRHTLEHVPNIRELVDGIHEMLAPGGVCFIEVPDADWVVGQLFAHEIWDEHITYFRAGSLAKLIRESGLSPIRLERARFRDTRNLLCWSVREPASFSFPKSLAEDQASLADLAGFQERWENFSQRLRSLVAVAPKPVIGIGASHIQLNFLNFTGLDDAIDILIDDDSWKAGRFAPLAKSVPIRTTQDILSTIRHGTLLKTAFPYPDWEKRVTDALQVFGIGSINPYGNLPTPEKH
jgi:2-polyprenyl-3-methyl-5-hydroxy-6-metoxy-1,4-benzoquinol methylase